MLADVDEGRVRLSSRTAEAIQEIRKAVIQAKIDLSERDETEIDRDAGLKARYATRSRAPSSRR